jgi:hypothetical protein
MGARSPLLRAAEDTLRAGGLSAPSSADVQSLAEATSMGLELMRAGKPQPSLPT